MDEILKLFERDSEYSALLETMQKQHIPVSVSGMCESARPFFVAATLKKLNKKGFIVIPEEKDAAGIAWVLSQYFERVLIYPARDFVFESVAAYSKEWEHERIKIQKKLCDGDYDVVIAVPDAVMQFIMPPELLKKSSFSLVYGDKAKQSEICERLEVMGYRRTEIVEGPGQYAVRGGILDVFSPLYEFPSRIDFFGDDIDRICIFDTVTQRNIENTENVRLLPCGELILNDEAGIAVQREIKSLLNTFQGTEKQRDSLKRELEAVENHERNICADRFYTLLYERQASVAEVAKNALWFVLDSRRVNSRAKSFWHTNYEEARILAEAGLCRLKNCRPLMTPEDFAFSMGKNLITVDMFASQENAYAPDADFSVIAKNVNPFSPNMDVVCEDVSNYAERLDYLMVLCTGERAASNFNATLCEHGIRAYPYCGDLHKHAVAVAALTLEGAIRGFELTGASFALLTDSAVNNGSMGGLRKRAASRIKKSERIASYADLEVGDTVVHVNHGIGRYMGIQNLVSEGISRDFIKIVYADGGILYVPCNQLDLVSKFVGGGDNVKLSKLGGSEWKRAKSRAKAAAADIAKELIRLYAERRKIQGFAFGPDDELQDEFEAGFEYIETDGQTEAAKEIKADMEKPYPMDRLLCGDVGFGKTEVALRAAFKCAFAGKQTAILVPTTILAFQHYQTIISRFRGYPVKAAMLSRFVPKRQADETVQMLRTGEVDIVVGTHRLLQKDIEFKDLGLLVVDEEQRFGVGHKERLKMLSKNVDVLTLTATPIPRTLNMALSGIRDMSVLEEAPMDRVPVQTFVLEHDDEIINEAIRRELRRGGQVFYLHNFIDSIYTKAMQISKAFPDSRVAIAHGQMDKEELSEIWRDMVEGSVDILVCTTIIETGVDIRNANTLIIENADRMGLSQLHQIRGRVGRSSRKAYAYFTFRTGGSLTEVAEKRLEAIREFTEFGSGFKIAMRDLELRGAGNILGAEQSGHLEAIGYDLYIRILEDAVNAEKGIAPKAELNCTVDIRVSAFVPEKYISSSKLRIDVYKKIASVASNEERLDLTDELTDRFGDIPRPVENLIDVSLIRNSAMRAGFTDIEQKGLSINLYHPAPDIRAVTVLADKPELRGRIMLSASAKPYVAVRLREGDSIINILKAFLGFYTEFKQNSGGQST